MDFNKAYNKLNSFTEGINDIDFRQIDELNKTIAQLESEIQELANDFRDKVNSAEASHEEYQKIRNEYFTLKDKVRELNWKYGKIVDWEEDNYWKKIDEKEHPEEAALVRQLEEQVEQLYKDMRELELEIYSKIDRSELDNKYSELENHQTNSKKIRNDIKQSYAELEQELKQVLSFININDENEWHLSRDIWYKDGRVRAEVFCEYVINGEIFELDDFDTEEDDEFKEHCVESFQEDVIRELDPKRFIEDFELEQSEKGDNWYRIPGTDWELLCEEPEAYSEEVPEIINLGHDPRYFDEPGWDDYEINGNLVFNVSWILGKRVY